MRPQRHRTHNQVGGDAAYDGLAEARHDFHSRLMRDVLAPLDSWRENLRRSEVCVLGGRVITQ